MSRYTKHPILPHKLFTHTDTKGTKWKVFKKCEAWYQSPYGHTHTHSEQELSFERKFRRAECIMLYSHGELFGPYRDHNIWNPEPLQVYSVAYYSKNSKYSYVFSEMDSILQNIITPLPLSSLLSLFPSVPLFRFISFFLFQLSTIHKEIFFLFFLIILNRNSRERCCKTSNVPLKKFFSKALKEILCRYSSCLFFTSSINQLLDFFLVFLCCYWWQVFGEENFLVSLERQVYSLESSRLFDIYCIKVEEEKENRKVCLSKTKRKKIYHANISSLRTFFKK